MSLGFEMQEKEPPEEGVMVSARVPAPEHQKPRLDPFGKSFNPHYSESDSFAQKRPSRAVAHSTPNDFKLKYGEIC
ncbi:hypothetical protein S83_036201 [Arachis hypogaea]